MHWQQGERDEAEVRAVAVEQFNAEPVEVEVAPAKPGRKRVAKVVKASDEALAAPVRKAQALRKAVNPHGVKLSLGPERGRTAHVASAPATPA